MTRRQVRTIVWGIALATLLAMLDQTVVSTALPRIADDFGTLSHYTWVVTAYLLASTAITPLYGKLGDIYGRKRTVQAAISIFLFGSVLCGVAGGMWQLVVFRAVQGLGGGGLVALSMSVIGDVVPPRQRGRFQGYFSGISALSSVSGPLVGGLLSDRATWRWIFFLNLPVGALAFALLGAALRNPVRAARRGEHRLDYVGAVLVVCATVSALLVTELGGRSYGWTAAPVVGLALLSITLAVSFFVWESRAAEPILPLRLFRDPVFRVASALGIVSGLTLFVAAIFLPQYLQIVKGESATRSGLMLLPFTLGAFPAAVLGGRLMVRTGRYKVFTASGALVLAAGLFLLSHLDAATSTSSAALWIFVVGAGSGGLFMQAIVIAVQNSVSSVDMGTATSAIPFSRTLGGALGTAVFGTLLAQRVDLHLRHQLVGHTEISGQTVLHAGGISAIRNLPEPVHSAVVDAFARSFHTVYLAAVPFALAAFVLALALEERPLRDTVLALEDA